MWAEVVCGDTLSIPPEPGMSVVPSASVEVGSDAVASEAGTGG